MMDAVKLQSAILLGAVCITAGVAVAEQNENVIPRTEMPDKVYRILREAVDKFQPADGSRQDWRERNLKALENLRSIPWPNFSKLERVRLYDAKSPTQFLNAWRLAGEGRELVLLSPDFTERKISRGIFSKVEASDYADELPKLIKFLKERDPGSKRPWDFTFVQDFGAGGLPFYGGVFLLHHAYAAAFLGKNEEAKAIINEALNQRGLSFEHVYNEGAWQSFFKGTQMLENGDLRKDVLEQWESTLTFYGKSEYREQLLDYVQMLKEQVEEDKKLGTGVVNELGALSEKERIAYCIARFPDVHGFQMSQPGHCMTISFFPDSTSKDTLISDTVVKIGRSAVPALIEHLGDKRLTRSIGFRRNFDPNRTVLRVQDVAVQCIEKIVDIRFYHPSTSSSYLSNEKPEVREKVIADLKAWWKENSDKSPLQGYQARLEQGRLYERVDVLVKIEGIDKKAVDSIAILKKWAVGADDEDQAKIALELGKRGDLSFLPAMREMAKATEKEIPYECVSFLLKYGSTDDYRFLREATLKDIEAGGSLGTSRIFGSVVAEIENSKNPLAAPILVDLLDRREITGSRWISDGRGGVGFSCADSCMGALIRLIEHDEGYGPGDPQEKRFVTIDRWILWWKREGKEAYFKKYPEVRKVSP